MTIHIESLTFECIIGILDFERQQAQKVIIDLTIDYDYCHDAFINYAEVITLIKEDMIENRYELLETALNALEKKLLATYPEITHCHLKITKPDILKDVKVALSKTFLAT